MPVIPIHLEGFLLIFIRTTAMLLSAPWFGNRAIPAQLKIGLMALISLMLFPIIDLRGLVVPQGLLGLSVGIGGELMVGITIGLIVRFALAAVSMAGQLIGVEVGLGTPGLLNPEFNEQSTVLHSLTDMVTMAVFLSLDAHHVVLRGLAHSFRVVPLLDWHVGGASVEAMVRLSTELWHIALHIAAPILAAQFLAKVVLALLARAAPQMNVFMVGFPLQIGMGLLILGLMMPMLATVLEQVFGNLDVQIVGMLNLLKP
jgi:flagellar biosynthetic protein FliR